MERLRAASPGIPLAALAMAIFVVVARPAPAFAQSPADIPKAGLQFLTAGLALNPGFIHDDTAPEGIDTNATTGGGTLRLGLQHAVATELYMAAEIELGNQWFNEHTASSTGRADSETVFVWQIALLGRWLPFGDAGQLSLGFGAHLWRAALEDSSMQMLAGDLRAGWYFWRKANFLLAEVGYAAPFIAGLDLPTNFSGEPTDVAEQNWTIHRFTIGFSYGF